MATRAPCLPSDVYAVFAGQIDQGAVQRIFASLAQANASHTERVHLLFQSTGGSVADGICLYNFFKTLSVDLTLYNSGSLSSIAVVTYLGAKKRMVSQYGSFMMHRSYSPTQNLTGRQLQPLTHALALDDERTEAILRTHITMPAEKWADLDGALFLSAQEAIAWGVADQIADFCPPPGTQIFNV
jgi:ATP-dependent Clp protease protease subunit